MFRPSDPTLFSGLRSWDNILALVAKENRRCAEKLAPHMPILKRTPPGGDGLASVLGFSLEQPPSDIRARCSSFDSYADFGDADSLADARAFLRYTLKCTELFSGDGFAYSAGGERGAREYLMRRLPVSSLWGAHWVELTGGILLCDGLK